MNIDSIENGIVLDHIAANKSMEIYRYLKLDALDCGVAVIRNVKSAKRGFKDIIKIDAAIDIDLDVLGYIDPGVTVNIIRDGKLVEKTQVALPARLAGVIQCGNPRCITSVEPGLEQVFLLRDREYREYRCAYCEEKSNR